MFRRGRPVDPAFAPTERLYRRFRVILYTEDGEVDLEPVLAQALTFPGISVNRSKYSLQFDVLYPRNCSEGVLVFPVSAIPAALHLPAKPTRAFSFWPEHVPCDGNYAHSEIRAGENGQVLDPKQPPPSIRTSFRVAVGQMVQAIREPTAPQPCDCFRRMLGL